MSIPANLTALVGEWSGVNQLWLNPNEPVRISETTAAISLLARDKFLTMRYTWVEGGQTEDGLLLFSWPTVDEPVQAVWLDSWHMGSRFMLCYEVPAEENGVAVEGKYAAPPGPDWGWRVSLVPQDKDSFQMIMHIITPDGEVFRAVQADFKRK